MTPANEPKETRFGYLRRIRPDVREIETFIDQALRDGDSSFYLDAAITRTTKLLDDLQRARRTT